MTSLTLRLRQPLSQRIDMSPFTLQGLAGKALDDIARIPLWLGNRQVDTGELFAIDGEVGDEIRIQSDSERQGMRGGTLLVKGDAGERAGDLLRRGTVLIGGDRGDYCASRMVAGTMVVLGHTGIQTGLAMRRGTLIVTRHPKSIPATFNDNGMHHLSFLTLLTRDFRDHAPFSALAQRGTRVQRWLCDLSCDGKGEILLLE